MSHSDSDHGLLTLSLYRRVIQYDDSHGVASAMELLKESDAQLRLEDILPFFPDFVKIGTCVAPSLSLSPPVSLSSVYAHSSLTCQDWYRHAP